MTMDLFERNIQAMKARFPAAAQRILAAAPDPDLTLFEQAGKLPTAAYCRDGKEHLLHSKYDPRREAEKLVAGHHLAESSNIVVLGCGFGYHVRLLAERERHRDFIVVCEQNPAILKAAFTVLDFTDVLSCKNVLWSVGDEPSQSVRLINEGMGISIVANTIAFVDHQPSLAIADPYYTAVRRAFENYAVYATVNVNTQIERTRDFVGNAFKNAEAFVRALPVSDLFGCGRGVAAFVVGAGPSLDKTVHLLHEAKGKAIIIAVDSAVSALVAHGIEPDFIVSIDFTPHTLHYFKGIDTGRAALVFDSEIHPGVLAEFSGRKYVVHLPKKSVSEWYTTIVGNKGAIQKGLSVSHVGMLLAAAMEAEEIVLVGQDLAYPRAHWHAKGSHFFQTLDVTAKEELHLCDTVDVFGGPVKSAVSLMVFKSHFEAVLDEQPELHCFDATEGGAFIRGTTVISLRDALVRFCRNRTWSFEPNGWDNENYQQDMDMFLAETVALTEQLAGFIRKLTGTVEKLDAVEAAFRQTKDRTVLHDALRIVRETSQELDRERMILELLKDSSTAAMLIRGKRRRNKRTIADATDDELIESMVQERDFFAAVLDGACFVRECMEQVLERNRQAVVH